MTFRQWMEPRLPISIVAASLNNSRRDWCSGKHTGLVLSWARFILLVMRKVGSLNYGRAERSLTAMSVTLCE